MAAPNAQRSATGADLGRGGTGDTTADGHVEAPDDRPYHGQIFLILRRDVGALDRAATVWAGGGKRGRVGLVDARRNGSSGPTLVGGAGVPARPFAAALGPIFRERGSLTEAGAPGRLELLFQPRILTLQAVALATRPHQRLAQAHEFFLLALEQFVVVLAGRARGLHCHTRFMADSRKKYNYKIGR